MLARLRWLPVTAGLAMTLGCAGPVEQPVEQPAAPQGADVVHLTYDWPIGLIARAHYRLDKEREGNGGDFAYAVKGHYRIETERSSQGLQVNFSEVELGVDDGGASPEGVEGYVRRLAAQAAAISPGYVVSDAGELVAVTDVADLRAALLQELEAFAADQPADVRQRIGEMLDRLLSEEQLVARIQGEWNRDVGQWLDARLERGYVYETEFDSVLPLAGNATVPTKAQYRYLGRVPCSDRDTGTRCVKLDMQSFIDPDGFRPAMERFFEQLGRRMPEDMDVRMDYTVTVVTEPDTLIPHEVRWSKVTVASLGEGGSDTRRAERGHIAYTYLRGAAVNGGAKGRSARRRER